MGRIDSPLYVARGPIDVAIKSELQDDAGLADTALRGHFGHVGDLAEVALQRAFRRMLRPSRGWHRNGWEVDLLQRRDRPPEEGEDAGYRESATWLRPGGQ